MNKLIKIAAEGSSSESPWGFKKLFMANCFFLLLCLTIHKLYKEKLWQNYHLQPTPTVVQIVNATPMTGGIFFCGYENFLLASHLFPDYMSRWWGGLDSAIHHKLNSPHTKRFPTHHDVLVFGMHGPCDNDPRAFPGKILFLNGEPYGNDKPPAEHNVYQIGLVPDSTHSVKIYHGAWNLLRHDPSLWSTLWDKDKKPKNTDKYQGLVYLNSNCQPHREDAVNKIANIMTVWHGGKCKGNALLKPDRFKPMPNKPPVRFWVFNRHAYSQYTFCLAMENSNTANYMSEKIVLAFLAGCIPIYYGSTEVFDVFNRHAFVFYDPDNPQPALQQLLQLANNQTAYQQVMEQPILANGDQTVRDYFSVSDQIGGGHLKHKLRQVMGLPV